MLLLSDSSDAKQIPPDAPLLTGYALPSGDFYVLAMTWPAPEVARPGCVWTHSLLIPQFSLELDDPNLLAVFERPRDEESWRTYGRSLTIKGNGSPTSGPNDPSVPTILWSLYDPPTPPVDLRQAAIGDPGRHSLLMSLWSQQWPSLRANFSFAEAPRVARRIDGDLMDLEITKSPQRSSWEQPRGRPSPRTVGRIVDRPVPEWCNALARDLRKRSGLREFLWEFGPTVKPTRESLWALASVWVALDPAVTSVGLDAALTAITRAFPNPDEGVELKGAVLGTGTQKKLPHPVDKGQLALALADADLSRIIDGDFEPLVKDLMDSDGESVIRAIETIESKKRSKQARGFLEAVGGAISNEQLALWAGAHPRAIAYLAKNSEELATKPALWTAMPFEDLWPGPARSNAAKGKREAILVAMLAADATPFVSAALSEWSDGSELFLNAASASSFSPSQLSLLQEIPDRAILDWLRDHGPAPAVAAALLETWKPKKLSKVPVGEWDALQGMGIRLTDFTLGLFYLAATAPDANLGPARAVAAYMELIDRLPSGLKKKAKRLLDEELNTDAGMAHAATTRLVDAFIDGDWPARHLFEVQKPEAFRLIADVSSPSFLGERLLPVLAEGSASDMQRDAIWDALESAEDVSALQKAVSFLRRVSPF